MRTVITGGAGFIGSHLCERFLDDGHELICVDNLLTGARRNIAGLFENPRFRFIEHNVSEPIEIDGPVDNVLHFASPASPVDYLTHPIPTLKVGSLGTHNALGLAKAKDARFLLASTSEVYGDPEVHPQREDYWGNVNPIGPRGCYDEAKRFAEAITMAYHRYHGVKTRIVRIFNTYGPRMRLDDGRVLPNFMKQALRGEPITLYGQGEQTRSFCYVSDLVEGIVRLLNTDFAEPVNLGNPNEITVMQLAQEIIDLVAGTKSKIVHVGLPEDDPKRRKPDITRARTLLGWEPPRSTASRAWKASSSSISARWFDGLGTRLCVILTPSTFRWRMTHVHPPPDQDNGSRIMSSQKRERVANYLRRRSRPLAFEPLEDRTVLGGNPPFAVGGDPSVNPADFRVTTFASGLNYPHGMLTLSDGSLLVAVSNPISGSSFYDSSGELLRFVDANGDGAADGSGQALYNNLPGGVTAIHQAGDFILATSSQSGSERISFLPYRVRLSC